MDRPARYRDQVQTEVTLPAEETAVLLTRVNQAYNTTTEDILLAALARALHAEMGRVETALTLEHHGRDEIPVADASRTIGWFTSLFPFLLELDPDRDLGFHIKAAKEAIRAVPHHGIGYGLLRYGSEGTAAVSRRPRPEISFNYLGKLDVGAPGAVFRLAPESIAGGVNHDAACLAEIEVSGMVTGRTLRLAMAWNRLRVAEDQIQALLSGWRAEILAVVAHCRARSGTELTPADLTYPGLSVDELEDMFS
jgi:non-ribosomal peptide synthase protein (TIGR01720 family)